MMPPTIRDPVVAPLGCNLCGGGHMEVDHDVSERHRRNSVLRNYALVRQKLRGENNGVWITCRATSSYADISYCTESVIKISAKPKERIKFQFTITNTNSEDIVIVFAEIVYGKTFFTVTDNGIDFALRPVIIKPRGTIHNLVVSFKSEDIGQYEMPVLFSFRKASNNDAILVVRDMAVYVEEKQNVHAEIASPFIQQDVTAAKIIKSTIPHHCDERYSVPTAYKAAFAYGLEVTEESRPNCGTICKEIKKVFEIGVVQENYIRFFHQLLWYDETIARINLKKYNMSGVPIQHRGDGFELVVPGLAEKRPSLMSGDVIYIRPHNNTELIFEGVVSAIRENTALIKGLDLKLMVYYATPGALFDIRFCMSRLTIERMHSAVNSVTNDSPNQRRVFPQPHTRVKTVKEIKNYYNPLVEQNPEQRTAVEHILAGTAGRAPYLVHGPPGTGKTVTIVEAVLQLVTKNSKNRILVCTDSNSAADHVATQLVQYADLFDNYFLLRANSQYRVWSTLPSVLNTYSNGVDSATFTPVSLSEFSSYSVAVTTLSHAAKYASELRHMNNGRHITHLFVDEAAQASEPATLIPICGLLKPSGALILAGDPQQLGPVVISQHARRLGLGLSLMERLKTTCPMYSDDIMDPNYMVMLRNNFRSHPDILKLPNDLFYNGLLRSMAPEDPISMVDILGEGGSDNNGAIVFHGLLSQEERMGRSPSYYNVMEFMMVKKYIYALMMKHSVPPQDIGVVAPYIRQVYKIKEWLATQPIGWDLIEVGTVEGFQGKEKRVIIISTVRANCNLLSHDAKFQLGFLVDDKRFNVALTRAKAKAIIIGNPLCLEKDAKWRMYMDRCRELGTYYGYDADNDEIRQQFADRIAPLLEELDI